MPIYEYKCLECGKISEFLVMSEDRDIRCVKCDSTNLKRVFLQSFSIGRPGAGIEQKSSCCGLENPCENPKRCCSNF